MADKQKTIDIIFGAVDKTGTAVKSVGNNLRSLERNVGSITGPMADITGNILKLDAAIAAAVIGLTAYGITVADDFGTSFAEISTLIGRPASELESFKNDIQSYAEQSGASFQDITDASYNAISAGVKYGDTIDLLTVSEKLSLAGRAELGITTKALVSTINAFGGSMADANDYSDIFFTTVQKGQTTLPELAESIGNVAPLAAQAGLDFSELGAAVAALTAGSGISTTEAMTALQAVISAVISPTEKAAKAAERLGIDYNAAALESKGLSGFLAEVKEKTGGNVAEMALLFKNARALKSVLPLTGSAADDFGRAMEAMEKRTDSTKNAAKELEQDLARLGQTLKNNVTSAFISFGENFTDETAGIIENVTSMFNSIGSEIKLDNGTFAPLISQLEDVFKDIESKFQVIAGNLPEALKGLDFSYLIGAFDDLGGELGESFRAIFGDVDLTTIEGLESALQTVVDAFTGLVNITSGIVDGLAPLFELIGAGASEFQNLSEEGKKSVGEMLGLASAIDAVLGPVSALGAGMNALGNGLIAVAGVSGLKAVIGQLGDLSTIAGKAGKAGLIGGALFGAGAAGFGFGTAINDLFEAFNGKSIGVALYDWINGDEATGQLDELAEHIDKTAKATKDLASAQEEAATTQEKSRAVKDLDIKSTQEQLDAYIKNAGAQKQFSDELNGTVEAQTKAAGAIQQVNEAIALGGDAVERSAKSTIELAKNSKSLSIEYDQATGKINSWSGAMGENSKALENQVDKTQDAIKKTAEYQTKLLELASDERIASIEANVSLNIAQLESDTKIAVSIIEGLSNTVSSTGDLLGNLWGSFNDASKFDQLAISKQIEQENANRKKALDIQNQLANEQINLLRAKAQALSKGESLIKVSAEGLTPALELIFNEIMSYAQVRATQDGLDLLLGA